MDITDRTVRRRALRTVPRSRGAFSGLVIMLLGAWGAVIPFVGPIFNYGYTPDDSWYWTSGRGWLEVLPGAVAVVAGVLMIISRSRLTASFAGWLAAVAGAWFVVGPVCAQLFHMGPVGEPISSHEGTRLLESLGLFYGVGALIVFLAAFALGRLSQRTVRDLHAAERSIEAEQRAESARIAQVEAARAQTATDPRPVSAESRPASPNVPASSNEVPPTLPTETGPIAERNDAEHGAHRV